MADVIVVVLLKAPPLESNNTGYTGCGREVECICVPVRCSKNGSEKLPRTYELSAARSYLEAVFPPVRPVAPG